MPFARPTKSDLVIQAQADLAGQLPGTDPLLRFANLRILAVLLGEGFNAEYGYLDWIAKQAVPFTAEGEAFQGWAGLKNQRQKAATQATGSGAWAGGVPDTLLPAETEVVRGDGWTYLTTADATVAMDGTLTAPLLAVTAGAAGTLSTGSPLIISQAVAGIPSAGVATAGAPGADLEDFDVFKTRVLQVFANPPQGGSRSDYVEWALQVPGVTRAWVVPVGMGAGTVVVYVMLDVSEAIHGGFPQGTGGVAAGEPRDTAATGDLLAVANYILPLQPVTPIVYLLAPQANTVTFTIKLPGASAALKTQIGLAIDATFLTYGAPAGVIDISDIEAAIAVLPGSRGFVITAVACDHGSVSPADGNITSNAGYLPVRGALTWT